PAMARITSHLPMAVEIRLVYGKHHLHHLSRNLLRLFVILLESALDVTEIALHTERSRNELHRWDELISRNTLQHLNVLELLLSRLWRVCPEWACLDCNESGQCDACSQPHGADPLGPLIHDTLPLFLPRRKMQCSKSGIVTGLV